MRTNLISPGFKAKFVPAQNVESRVISEPGEELLQAARQVGSADDILKATIRGEYGKRRGAAEVQSRMKRSYKITLTHSNAKGKKIQSTNTIVSVDKPMLEGGVIKAIRKLDNYCEAGSAGNSSNERLAA